MTGKIKINYTAYLVNGWLDIVKTDILLLKSSGLFDECEELNIFAYPYNEILIQTLENECILKNEKTHIFWLDENRYEFPAINDIRDNPYDYNLYFHTKGVTTPYYDNEHVYKCSFNWHMYMAYYNILNWKTCIQQLDDGNDVVGVLWDDRRYYSGNFWWASKEHILKLRNIKLDTSDRFEAERFIASVPGKYVSNCKSDVSDLYLEMFDYRDKWNTIIHTIRNENTENKKLNILFVTNASGIDYLSDCIFHGLVSLGHNVTDSKYMWYMSGPIPEDKRLQLYGLGMTISGNLSMNRVLIDRTNIENRIKNHEFDVIVYGSIRRCSDYIELVSLNYPKESVIICDGEDDNYIDENYSNIGIMFKRELLDETKAHPISFAIPKEKLYVRNFVDVKNRFLAKMIPETSYNRRYLYTNEHDYYNGYLESYFGITCKKAGWDCLRHYEIIANHCIPVFFDYSDKPKTIMTNWPSKIQKEANILFDIMNTDRVKGKELDDETHAKYITLLERFFNYCSDNLTTECLAKYILKFTN